MCILCNIHIKYRQMDRNERNLTVKVKKSLMKDSLNFNYKTTYFNDC